MEREQTAEEEGEGEEGKKVSSTVSEESDPRGGSLS